VLADVMWNRENLQWIDLSYNHLTQIEPELLNFPQIKVLYLHGNAISNLEECRKLQNLTNLQTLTLYGNPIEQIKGYRMWVLGVMY
jgi:Leucine-rich repeat (LRR) protein